jgi:hypothetical protein
MKAKSFVKQFWLAGVAALMAAVFGLAGCDQLTNSDDTYSVAIGVFDHGSVTADKASAEKGDLITLTVTPATGYRLAADSLTVTTGGTAVTTTPSGNTFTFTMPASNVTVTAVFEAAYTITFNSGEGGSTVAAITQGAETEVTKPADPAKDGYTFLGWFDAEEEGTTRKCR